MLLQRAQAPDSPTSLLMMLARAQMPEKYGPARRGGPPRDNRGCDHHCHQNSQPTATSQYDKDFLDDVRRDLQDLKQFAGLSEPDLTPAQPSPNPSPEEHETPTHPDLSPADPSSVGAGFKPAHDPSTSSAASPPTPSPVLGEGWGEGQEPSAQNLDPDFSPTDPSSAGAGFKPAQGLPAGDEGASLSNLSPTGGETQRGGTTTDHAPVGAGFKPAHDPPAHSAASPPTPSPVVGEGWGEGQEPSAQNLDPNLSPAGGEIQRGGSSPTPQREPAAQDLTRSQRRQLQRKQRKHQTSRLARAPT